MKVVMVLFTRSREDTLATALTASKPNLLNVALTKATPDLLATALEVILQDALKEYFSSKWAFPGCYMYNFCLF